MAKKDYMSKTSLTYFWQILKNTFAKKTDLSTIATSGSYSDLLNKPVIPTKVSQLDNDDGFITNETEIYIGLEEDAPEKTKLIITDEFVDYDEFPLGTVIEYDGDEVPEGYEEVEDKGEIYSTEEVRIGTWIDGKPLYRKVVNFGTLPNAAEKTVAHNIDNIDSICKVYGVTTNPSAATFSIPIASTVATKSIYVFTTKTNVVVGAGSDRTEFTKTYIIIEYTKTTD